MPTYVYKFIDTDETIEVQQAFTDDSLTHFKHPGTGRKMKVKKVFTPVGVTFRGGGFYKTDSRGGSSKTSGTTGSTESTTGSSSTSSNDSTSSSDASKTAAPAKESSSTATPAAKAPAKSAASRD